MKNRILAIVAAFAAFVFSAPSFSEETICTGYYVSGFPDLVGITPDDACILFKSGLAKKGFYVDDDIYQYTAQATNDTNCQILTILKSSGKVVSTRNETIFHGGSLPCPDDPCADKILQTAGYRSDWGLGAFSETCLDGCVVGARIDTIQYYLQDGTLGEMQIPVWVHQGRACSSEPPAPPEQTTDGCITVGTKTLCADSQLNCGTVNGEQICVDSVPDGTCAMMGDSYICVDSPLPYMLPDGSTVSETGLGFYFPDSDGDSQPEQVKVGDVTAPGSGGTAGDVASGGTGDGTGDGGGGGGGGGNLAGPPEVSQPESWWEKKYPDGVVGVYNAFMSEAQATPLFQLVNGFTSCMPSGGSCPSWNISVNLGVGMNFGSYELQPPCWIWDAIRGIMIFSALLLARRLIFGG